MPHIQEETDGFYSKLSVLGCLYSDHPGKIEILSPFDAMNRYAYCTVWKIWILTDQSSSSVTQPTVCKYHLALFTLSHGKWNSENQYKCWHCSHYSYCESFICNLGVLYLLLVYLWNYSSYFVSLTVGWNLRPFAVSSLKVAGNDIWRFFPMLRPKNVILKAREL